MTAERPRFSVVIPTYRRDELLKLSLASVLAQTFADFEVIVVDDARSKTARSVVESFGDERVSYVHNDRAAGGAGTRNAGVARARGEWVAFLDDDDLWLPEKLRRVDNLIASVPDVGFVYTGHEKFSSGSNAVTEVVKPELRGWVQDELLYRNRIGGMSVAVARRDLLEAVGGLDERFSSLQDLDLFVRLAGVGIFDFVPDPLVRIRQTPGVRISSDRGKKLTGAILFAQKYDALIRRSPKLRHRTAARTFNFALNAGDRQVMAANAAWTFLGLVFDPGNVGYVALFLGRWLRDRLRAV